MKRPTKTKYFVARDNVLEGVGKTLHCQLSPVLHSRYQVKKAHKRLITRFPDAYMIESVQFR